LKEKLLSAFLSATTFSAIMTFVSQQNQTAENVYYFPSIYVFYVESAILLPFFIFFAIPLSLVANMIIYHRAKQKDQNVFLKPLFLVFVIGLGVSLLLFKRIFYIDTLMNALFYYSLCGAIFLFYERLIHYLRKIFFGFSLLL